MNVRLDGVSCAPASTCTLAWYQDVSLPVMERALCLRVGYRESSARDEINSVVGWVGKARAGAVIYRGWG